ncbi:MULTISPECIES: hypothetical protein [Nocardiaceae]|nr:MULTISPECIES: hypothetical protein [Rhodococcus]
MSERSAYDDPDPIADPAPVDETWVDNGWHGSLGEMRAAGELEGRSYRR